ncbi:hypothetical protein RRG08_059025 [Elysia crispata]|uniref:Hemicentin-1 n=1 Tax=Elysia crispata TaxID=231223 RepID=A0AAE0XUY6_9GAST|nr:hypothetical protein RRG08_059025 [Elysia crispata]
MLGQHVHKSVVASANHTEVLRDDKSTPETNMTTSSPPTNGTSTITSSLSTAENSTITSNLSTAETSTITSSLSTADTSTITSSLSTADTSTITSSLSTADTSTITSSLSTADTSTITSNLSTATTTTTKPSETADLPRKTRKTAKRKTSKASRTSTRKKTNNFNGQGEQYGGRPCAGAEIERRACPVLPLVRGTWHDWSAWSACSGSCSGVQTRTRNCTDPTLCFTPCRGDSVQWRNCGDQMSCCAPRMWTPWGQWEHWTRDESHGVRKRYRRCEAAAMMVGQLLCPERCKGGNVDRETCTESMWNPWSHWSACEDRFGRLDNDTKQPCGDQSGQMKRSRSCRRGSCQRNCVGDNEQSIACQMKPCCEDPVWSTWSDWGECSDAGLQKRKRMCASDRTKWRSPTCQSRRCQGPRIGTQRCDVCPACVKREWSSWFEWSPCGSDHGQSRRYKVRYRSCIADQRSSGPWCSDPCEGSNMDTEECCTSSSWGEWSAWGRCSSDTGQYDLDTGRPCGNGAGIKNRNRTCQYGTCGDACAGDRTSRTSCYIEPCCAPARWEPWTEWSTCNNNEGLLDRDTGQPCGKGKGCQTRNRTCILGNCDKKYCEGDDTENTYDCEMTPCCGANLVGMFVNCSLAGANLVAIFVNRGVAGANLVGMFVNRSLAGANLVGMFVNRGVAGANLVGMFINRDLAGANLVAIFVNRDLAGVNLAAIIVNRDLAGANLAAIFVNRGVAGANLVAIFVNRGVAGANHVVLCVKHVMVVPRVLSGWTPWEECTGNPLKSTRRRHCHPIPTTREILRYCRGGPECDTTNLLEERRCYCGSVEWQPWQRWTECDLPQTRFRTRTRTCRVVRNSTPECPRVAPTCSGLGRESKRCPCGMAIVLSCLTVLLVDIDA